MSSLIPPVGGRLVDLLVPASERDDVRHRAATLPSIQLSERSLCDLELLATGAFSPLDGFMSAAQHDSVVKTMRLPGGQLFPIPIILPVDDAAQVAAGQELALRDAKNNLLAVMQVEEVFAWDRDEVAEHVFGTRDAKHPLVAEMKRWGLRAISGPLRVLQVPAAYDFRELRRTPAEVRALLEAQPRANVVAFQTRNPLHRVHEELTRRAIDRVDGVLLLHPVVGLTKPGDVDHYTRVRTYKALVEHYYPRDRVILSLLPLAMRMAGPREALWHALIRRNYGANHFIVGRDHASPGVDSTGKPFYGPYDAQELVAKHATELGITMVPFEELVYLPDEDRYEEASRIADGARTLSLSGTQVREQYLAVGRQLPEWFTRPHVAAILAESHPALHQQGFCVWFTGLSGAGKTTTAEVLVSRLLERGRQSTVLDGDVVRTHLSKGLGFSREDRDTNIMRIGFVAAEVVRHAGVAVCAAVSPYRATRDAVRSLVGADRFVEVHVDAPLEICESRDAKGMYAQARAGLIRGFTGIDDPYEEPASPEVRIDSVGRSPQENADAIIAVLVSRGFLRD